MSYTPRAYEQRTHSAVPASIGTLANPSFVLLSHPSPQPATRGEPNTVSSFYLGRSTRPNPGSPSSIPRKIEGYFIDVHSKGIKVTPFDGPSNLSAEQIKEVIDEFTRQLRTTPEGHAIMSMSGLTDEQLMALNIETIVHTSYKH